MDSIFNGDLTHLPWQDVLLSILATFVLTTALAWTWIRTHDGLSYSRSLPQAFVLGGLVACVIMLAIADNLARGIGIVGSLAVIRFRNNLRDPRDIVFVFGALGVGVACGVQAWLTALAGAVLFVGAAVVLRASSLGSRLSHDGLLRFQAPADPATAEAIAAALRGATRRFVLISVREIAQGQAVDHAYHITLPDPDDPEPLLRALRGVPGIKALAWLTQTHAAEA